jgi:cell division protein FtsN
MKMIVRPKRGESSARRRARSRTGREKSRAAVATESTQKSRPTVATEPPSTQKSRPTLATEPAPTQRTGIASERHAPRSSRKRTGGPSEDTAVYSCQCGYVFEASVSTTVGCPHCGHTQAW